MGTCRFKFFIFLSLLVFGIEAKGAITILSISGASSSQFGQTTSTPSTPGGTPTTTPINPIVYGGTAGSDCTAGGDSTCNNCTGGLTECNPARIGANVVLTIQFSSNSVQNIGRAMILNSTNNPVGQPSTQLYNKGDTATLTVRWGDICSSLPQDPSADCSLNDTGTFSIGLDNNGSGTFQDSTQITFKVVDPAGGSAGGAPNSADVVDLCDSSGTPPTNGLCDFGVYPGDEKVYIDQLQPAGSFPNGPEGVLFNSVVFFYSAQGFTQINNASPSTTVPITIDSNGSVSTNTDRITGLTNDTAYFFRIASQDQAGNIAYFTSDNAIGTACNKPANQVTPSDNCRFVATPDKVLGLLTQDLNCFIATAAYGSSLDQHLPTFRKFRNRFLLPNPIGRELNNFYYKWGPYPARFIQENPTFQPLARSLLWPLWGFAWASLKWGLIPTFVLSLGLLSALATLGFRIMKRAKTRTAS